MIEEFSFGNFWSFKEINSLNLTAAKIKSKSAVLDSANTIPVNNQLSLLKSKAIFGANASGKSNVIRALVTFLKIVRHSVKEEEVLSLINSFRLSTETEDEPTFFQLIFRYENIKYRYGFETTDEKINSEWLFATPNVREQVLFIREHNKIIELSKTHYAEGHKLMSLLDDNENEIFRNNSLFLSSVASFGFGKLSKNLIQAISSITVISGLGHQGMYNVAGDALDDAKTRKYIINFLKYADVGINDLDTIEVSKENLPENVVQEMRAEYGNRKKKKLVISRRFKYNKYNDVAGEEVFSFALQESEGTKKMFELSPFIYNALQKGTPLIIDEFDSRFHPLLTKKIVELFNSKDNSNAQLIFVTHDTNFLSADILRRDQIDFVEKDKFGASRLYTLVQFKGVRNTASFEKDYFRGKYGGIPFLGDFGKIFNAS